MAPPTRTSRPAAGRDRRRDFVDLALAGWRREQPELDLRPAEVFERIIRISRAVEKEAEALCGDFGITYWAFTVLVALRRSGQAYRLTPTELYRAGMVSSGGMTKRLVSLEGDGYIERVPAEQDRRSTYVRLTTKGRRLVDEITPHYLEMQADLLGGLAGSQRAELAGHLRALLVEIEGATERVQS